MRVARVVVVTVGILAVSAVTGQHAVAQHAPRVGGPGLHGGAVHAGTATSIRTPGQRYAGPPPQPGPRPHPPGPGPGPAPQPHPPGPGPHPGPPPGPGPRPPGPPPGPGPHPPGPPPPPYHWDWDDGWHPWATAAAVGVVAGVTAAAIGDVYYGLPSNCVSVLVGSVTYFQCGSVWYQPRYAGTGVTYIVVTPPR